MDKNAIKKYAVWARKELIARVAQKADQYEITEKKATPADADSIGGRVLAAAEKKQRQALIAKIDQDGFEQVMEEAAYTWFNRFTALRFMEVNNYLPSHTRVFTNESGEFKPQILADAIQLDLEGLDMDKVFELKDANKTEELYKYLLITQCNALSGILPRMFQRIEDYTELLLPDYLLREGSVIEQMITLIPEEDWTDQVQIIGWLYQYYNSEKKDDVFAALKKNVKITKENIPAATQLFTPDWIVRYMVENSLGRLWLEGHPGASEQLLPTEEEQSAYIAGNREPKDTKWHYYLEEAEQEPEVQAQLAEIRKEYAALTPDQLKVIDPCSGSGHILAYMFDVLMKIYESYGYTTREAVASIVENNLYGLDIDERAAQLAYFAVMMKARQYDRRFFSRGIQPHVYAIVESNYVDQFVVDYFCNGDAKLKAAVDTIFSELHDAKEYGSILTVTSQDWSALYDRFAEITEDINMSRDTVLGELLPLVQVAEALAQKYDAVVTNPPYMGGSGMSTKLSNFVKKNYQDSKSDLFAVFIEKCGQMAKKNGYQAMITQHAWMFLSSFEKLRTKLLQKDIVNMAHLGARAFEEIGGEVVQTTCFVVSNRHINSYQGSYVRLVDGNSESEKALMFFNRGNYYVAKQSDFEKMSGSPIAYWISNKLLSLFENKSVSKQAKACIGMRTGDNMRFLRVWFEVEQTKECFSAISAIDAVEKEAKWIPYNKGGEYRKWYGNHEYVVNWENDGFEIKENTKKVYPQLGDNLGWKISNENRYFKRHICWTDLTTKGLSFRDFPVGFIFDASANAAFVDEKYYYNILAYLNCKLVDTLAQLINPTLHFKLGNFNSLPMLTKLTTLQADLAKQCVNLSKDDWDSFETSWDFLVFPLVLGSYVPDLSGGHKATLAQSYAKWKKICEERFIKLKANEEELNRIFIDIYGLQDELTPEVADKDVTVHRIFDTKDDVPKSMKGSSYVRTKRDEIVSLISYAVGCMFGRYSLDEPGLILAGQRFSEHFYEASAPRAGTGRTGAPGPYVPIGEFYYKTENGIAKCTYSPDKDNIIPICDDEYFEDDIVGRFVGFVKTVYGEDTLDENLKFIADALGGKGQPREVIRNYFLNDFYKDHCKIYQKRPIYWLFDSGKKNGFKALIYMHRYQPDTIARIRTDYVHEQQSRYRTEIADLEKRIANAATGERVKLNKELNKLQAQAEEIRVYEEKIHHLADQMICIDLDDGVKNNYEIFKDVLAKIK